MGDTTHKITDSKNGGAAWRTTPGGGLVVKTTGTTDMRGAGAVTASTTEAIRAQEMVMAIEREVTAQFSRLSPVIEQQVLQLIHAHVAPMSTQLCDLASDTYALAHPVAIIIEQCEEEVTARWPEVEAFGAGDAESLAIAALRQDIVDLYLDLRDAPDSRLGRNMQAIKRVLVSAVVESGYE